MTSTAKRNISLSSAILFLNIEETWYRRLRRKMFSARAYVLILMSQVFSLAYAYVMLMLMLCLCLCYAYALVRTSLKKPRVEGVKLRKMGACYRSFYSRLARNVFQTVSINTLLNVSFQRECNVWYV